MLPKQSAGRVEAPTRPRSLSGAARQEWDRAVAELTRQRRLAEADHALLVAHCTAWGRFCEVEAQLRDDGYTAAGSKGQETASALFGVWRTLHERVVATSKELGLHAGARARLPEAGPLPDDTPSVWDALEAMGREAQSAGRGSAGPVTGWMASPPPDDPPPGQHPAVRARQS